MSVLDQAKRLRSHRTEAEQRLWHHLRAHRFMGLNFKRQKPIGRYVVDFVRQERRVIVEVDGGHHAGQTECDRERGSWLRERGYEVLRVWNHEVMQQLDGVLERIRLAALALPPTRVRGVRCTGHWKQTANDVGSQVWVKTSPRGWERSERQSTP